MSEEERVKYNFQPELEYVLAQDPFCIKIHVQNIDEWTKPSYERCKWAVGIICVAILPHISNNMIRKWIGPTPSTEEFASLLELTHGIYHPTSTRRKKFHARVHANARTIIVQIQYFNDTISPCIICMQWWPTICGCTCSIYIISSLEFDVIPFSLTVTGEGKVAKLLNSVRPLWCQADTSGKSFSVGSLGPFHAVC